MQAKLDISPLGKNNSQETLPLVTSTGIAKKQFHVMDINDRKEQKKKQSHRENLFHFDKVKKKIIIHSLM